MPRLLTPLSALLLQGFALAQEPTPPTDPPRELHLLLRELAETRRLLYVTAHPDDEDAGLLAYYAHGRGMEVELLTLTRGEGGQNEIGPELFHELGVLRSHELMAAHRYDGARQSFTRAFDFGYSFSVEETFAIWGKERVLADVVAVMRRFQPEVVVCLTPDGPGGGQHHQASGRIVIEAFERAADPSFRPELGKPHRALRLFRQIWGEEPVENGVALDLSTYDPWLGASYAEFGILSRGQHKCQGMVQLHPAFPRRVSHLEWIAAAREERRPLADLFEGIDRPLLERDGKWLEAAWDHRAALDAIRAELARGRRSGLDVWLDDLLVPPLEGDPETRAHRETLRERVDRLRELLSGLRVEARVPRGAYLARGETVLVELAVENTGETPIDVDLEIVGEPLERAVPAFRATLAPGRLERSSLSIEIAADAEPTLARPVPESAREETELTFDPTRPPSPPLRVVGTFRGKSKQAARVRPVPVVHVDVRSEWPSWRRHFVHVVPDPSIRPVDPHLVLPFDGEGPRERRCGFLVSSTRAGKVIVEFETDAGLRVFPERMELTLERPSEERLVEVVVSTEEARKVRGSLRARARRAEDSRVSTHGHERFDYEHVRPGALLVRASVEVVAFPCAFDESRRVGYVRGVGDRLPEALTALGVEPRWLDAEDLLRSDLGELDVIVTGVRAYLVRDDLRAAHERLMDWVQAGGTWIVMYQKFEWNQDGDPLSPSPFAPYPARVTNRRVTLEDAPAKVLQPEHPLWHEPNELGADTWNSWVQERGLYFLEPRDERYLELVEFEDPWPFNAGPRRGALVEAKVGEGHFLYCGLALFRQLPAGVPGAYRLFANLLSR